MSSVSPKQHHFMEAVKHNPAFAKKVGIKQSVGADFVAADKAAGKYANGGIVRRKGYANGGAIDNVPIMATKGEYMLPVDTARAVGKKKLDRLVAATHTPILPGIHKMANGGTVGDEEQLRLAQAAYARSLPAAAPAAVQAPAAPIDLSTGKPATTPPAGSNVISPFNVTIPPSTPRPGNTGGTGTRNEGIYPTRSAVDAPLLAAATTGNTMSDVPPVNAGTIDTNAGIIIPKQRAVTGLGKQFETGGNIGPPKAPEPGPIRAFFSGLSDQAGIAGAPATAGINAAPAVVRAPVATADGVAPAPAPDVSDKTDTTPQPGINVTAPGAPFGETKAALADLSAARQAAAARGDFAGIKQSYQADGGTWLGKTEAQDTALLAQKAQLQGDADQKAMLAHAIAVVQNDANAPSWLKMKPTQRAGALQLVNILQNGVNSGQSANAALQGHLATAEAAKAGHQLTANQQAAETARKAQADYTKATIDYMNAIASGNEKDANAAHKRLTTLIGTMTLKSGGTPSEAGAAMAGRPQPRYTALPPSLDVNAPVNLLTPAGIVKQVNPVPAAKTIPVAEAEKARAHNGWTPAQLEQALRENGLTIGK